ncbi:MAG: F0F1 ATP synthase subunit A [Candidatus Moranbacteria bacterium]|nr:F0F1 ATP synthase subunit A [Candidatus Moranbacteria bacterium]
MAAHVQELNTVSEEAAIPASQEVSHESTLFAEPILKVGNFTITNSLIASWITVVILVLFFIAIGKKVRTVPKGAQNIFEFLLEKALEMADSVTGSRKKSEKFLPISLALFLFILVNNWLGLLPGFGTIGFIEAEEGRSVFVPLLRGGTADINTTLALALFAIIASHVMGALTIGIWSHFNKFVNLKAFHEIPRKIKKDISIVLVNPIKAFVGIVELIGEVAKVASLSFRLFGNIFAGEVLLASMMMLFAFFLPLPFMFLEIIVGMIQALIFAMLTLVFMSIATQDHSEH